MMSWIDKEPPIAGDELQKIGGQAADADLVQNSGDGSALIVRGR